MIASTTRWDVSWLPPTTGRSGAGRRIASERHVDVQRAIAAVVGRHVGRRHGFHRVVHGRARDVVGRVHRPARGRTAAAEVEVRLVAADLHAHVDAQRRGDRRRRRPPSPRPRTRRPGAPRSPRASASRTPRAAARSRRAASRRRSARPAPRSGAPPRRWPRTARRCRPPAPRARGRSRARGRASRGPGPVRRHDPERRDADPFLMRFGRPRDVAPRDGAADVGPVRQVDREREQPALREDRADRLHVRQVVAADLRKVQEPHVALAELRRRHALEELLHGERHHAHVDGDVAALRDQPPLGVGERRRQVARLLQERRARRAHDDHAHLLGDRVERAAHDLEGDGMDLRRRARLHRPVSMTRLPSRSAAHRWPGATSVVDHSSSMRAGPRTARPGTSRARW